MKRTTTITINGERWKVPRGFGALYKRIAQSMLADTLKPGKIIGDVTDIMRLVGYEPTREAVADWPLRKRVEAVIWSATAHARAGDNPVQRHPDLEWLPKPWQGPWMGKGAFAGPTPTEIRT